MIRFVLVRKQMIIDQIEQIKNHISKLKQDIQLCCLSLIKILILCIQPKNQ